MTKEMIYEIYPGNPLPFGASIEGDVVNFSIYSSYATSCTLVLFRAGEVTPFEEIDIPSSYRIGDVFAIGVKGLNYHEIEYGYRLGGPNIPEQGDIFDPSVIILDPVSRAVGG